MFAQVLISVAVIAVSAYLLWRLAASPLIRYLAGPRPPTAAEGGDAAVAAGADELLRKRSELEQLERELALTRALKALDPRIARLRRQIGRLKEGQASADREVASIDGRGGDDEC